MSRLQGTWRALPLDGRIAAGAAVALFATMFLPWYQLTNRSLATRTLSAYGDFSWVEAAVLLVAVAVLVLLFVRAEGRAFHLPGGDGTVILAAGAWVLLLLAWRAVDKPGTAGNVAVGLSWGFVFAFAAAGVLGYAGFRMRQAHRPEPPLPGDEEQPTPAMPDGPPPRREASAARAEVAQREHEPATAATEPLARRRGPRRGGGRPAPPSREQLPLDPDLTRAHGSEEPLPRDDLDRG